MNYNKNSIVRLAILICIVLWIVMCLQNLVKDIKLEIKNDILKEISLHEELQEKDNTTDVFLLDNHTTNQAIVFGNLYAADIAAIDRMCDTYNIDSDFILAVIRTQTNGVVNNRRGLLNVTESIVPYIIEDQFNYELKIFLIKGGYYTANDLEHRRKNPRVTLLEGYIKVYGVSSLRDLYNNYYEVNKRQLR